MILNIASIIIAVAVVLVTFLYMLHTKRLADDTKRMADIVSQEFEFKIAPIIQIERKDEKLTENLGTFTYEIINKGSLPVHIARIVLEWWFEELPDKVDRKEQEIDKVFGGGEARKFKFRFYKDDMVKDYFEKSKNLSFCNLLELAKCKIYAIYKDRNENEHKTRDFASESLIDIF